MISIAPVDFTAVDFTAVALPADKVSPSRTMDMVAPIPVHSAALIMEESQEASLLAGSRASAAASMEPEVLEAVVFTEAEAVAGNSVQPPETKLMIWRKKSCARIK